LGFLFALADRCDRLSHPQDGKTNHGFGCGRRKGNTADIKRWAWLVSREDAAKAGSLICFTACLMPCELCPEYEPCLAMNLAL
jgi:hypothetical protein